MRTKRMTAVWSPVPRGPCYPSFACVTPSSREAKRPSAARGSMEFVALLFAVLAAVALALYVFVESETRGLVALLFAIAIIAMSLTIDGASRTAAILVWSVAASAVPLLFSVHLYLRLSREERGARRIRPQGLISTVAVASLAVVLLKSTSLTPRRALDDARVASTLLDLFGVPMMLMGAALLATFVVGLLATRRQV